MSDMYLKYFTNDDGFPFCIQYGFHEEPMFMHSHIDFFELVIVLNGTAIHIVDNERYEINKGDVFVIGNNTTHGYLNTKDFKICNLMFRPDSLLSSEYDIKKAPGFHALFIIEPFITQEHNFQSKLKLHTENFETVADMVKEMIFEYETKSIGWQTFVNSRFLELVVRLSRAYTFAANDPGGTWVSLSLPVSYMERHYLENININQLAERSGFSPRHFTRLFLKTYNTTPIEYIIHLRLQKACSLLKGTRLSISEIAFQCGYNDSNYFTRQFRKEFSLTPSEYRQSA